MPGRERSPGKTAFPGAGSPEVRPAWATSAELRFELKAEANPGSTGAGDGGAVAAAGSGATAAATAEDAWRPGKEGRAGVTEGVLEMGKGGKEALQEPSGT